MNCPPHTCVCEIAELRARAIMAEQRLGAVHEALTSHVDGRNLLDELNPTGWHHCDIVVRIGGKDRHFQGDWLKNLWYALKPQAKPDAGGGK